MPDTDLSPDCAQCAALCCVAFAFDRSAAFAYDKPAGEACRHLVADGCAIHPQRPQRGMGGCVRYDCLGAGQWVTQQMFGGGDWRRDPALRAPMAAAFLEVERGRRLLAMLAAAQRLDLPAAPRRRLARLTSAVRRAAERGLGVERLEAEARDFLPALRAHVAPR